MSKIRYKAINAPTKALGDDGVVEAVVSTETPDREGDIIRSGFWNLKNFKAHSPLISSHKYLDLRAQIGKWTKMKVDDKQLIGTAQYFIGRGNPEADWAYELAKEGEAAYSVGFIPDMDKAKQIGEAGDWGISFEFKGQELFEVSQVLVPANPEALQRMKAMQSLLRRIKQEDDEDEPEAGADGFTADQLDQLRDLIVSPLLQGFTEQILALAEALDVVIGGTEGEPETEPKTLKEMIEQWVPR